MSKYLSRGRHPTDEESEALYALNDAISEWASSHLDGCTDEDLNEAVHAVVAILAAKEES